MVFCLKLLLFSILCVKQEVELSIAFRKFVYQKDMSEYCRRRVMPSVFLGRQVIDAYSQILHFSRLELPYSCFVSIRTESGSNIILVIQLMSDKSLIESCRDSKNQLLVYEIGETFGGYWGPLPDNVLRPEPVESNNRYTVKTTQPSTTYAPELSTNQRRTRPPEPLEPSDKTLPADRMDYIRLEVPIVNVSAKLVPGRLPAETIFDREDSFDTLYDVTPWPGVSYKTKLLPLVQFSIEEEVSARRTGNDTDYSPRYRLDFNTDILTPDSRLTFPPLDPTSRKPHKYKYNANRRLNFKKKKYFIAEKEATFSKKPSLYWTPSYSVRPNNIFTRHYDFMQSLTQETELNSWDVVDDILKNLSHTADDVKSDKHLTNLIHGLSKTDQNNNVLLVPNISMYRQQVKSTPRPVLKYRTDSITWRQPPADYRTNYFDEVDDTSKTEGLSEDFNKSLNTLNPGNNDTVINNDGDKSVLLPLALDVDGVILNVTSQRTKEYNTTTSTTTHFLSTTSASKGSVKSNVTNNAPKIVRPMTLLDHESWENMVHAASLMAVMLNQSSTQPREGVNKTLITPNNAKGRKKRYVHVIPIDHAKPHRLPAKLVIPSSTVPSDKMSDAQEFQRLLELQDDEIHDRVALRYLRQYVGPALFNICDFDEAAARHVYLFNSSRLVLAISNFTLERMTVVMTPARTLLSSSARCAPANLECQVSGARVCIDSLSACDGVPNCGSYDIYDEDRLTCGGSSGLQHNVCLAAITFLAVLLTILYTVHYWLKRCVPKVSDAFFIYTDAAENILYLDPVMRSPHDPYDGKYFYRSNALQNYMECTDMKMPTHSVGPFLNRCFKFFGCHRKHRDGMIEDEYEHMHPDGRRLGSLGEMELSKTGPGYSSDVAVQTGSSLEINVFEKIRRNERMYRLDSETDVEVGLYAENRRSAESRSILDFDMVSNQLSDELNIMKFFRKARSVSMQMSFPNEELSNKVELPATRQSHTEEKEIQCHVYDHGPNIDQNAKEDNLATIRAEISDTKPPHVRKKLRFEEGTKITQSDSVDDAMDEEYPSRPRRSIIIGSGKAFRTEEMDSTIDADEPSTSSNREFKSYFWGGGKSKTKKSPKKKAQVSLR